MKKKIFITIYLLIMGLVLISSNDATIFATKLEYVKCGTANGIPAPVPQMTTIAFTLLIVGTPLALIIFSVIALIKAISDGNADNIMKVRSKLMKKVIAAVVIFLMAGLGKFVLTKVATNDSDKSSISSCVSCFLYDSNCIPSDSGNDVNTTVLTTRGQVEGSTSSNTYVSSTSNDHYNRNSNSNNNSTPAQKTIFVGDSRTVGMCGYGDAALHNGACKDQLTVCQGGMGHRWLKSTGITEVNKTLSQNSGTKFNIVILLGVNDVGNQEAYVTEALREYGTMIQSEATTNWKNHNVIFVSILPLGASVTTGQFPVAQAQINSFNNQMKTKISSMGLSNVKYCDAASSIDLSGKIYNDHIHYTSAGYETMYNQIKTKCL